MKILQSIAVVILAALAIEGHASDFDACHSITSIVAKNPAVDGSRRTISPGTTVIVRGVAQADALTLQIPTDADTPAWPALSPWNLRFEVADCKAAIQVDAACLPVGDDAVACAEATGDLVLPVENIGYSASGIHIAARYIPAARSNLVLIQREHLSTTEQLSRIYTSVLQMFVRFADGFGLIKSPDPDFDGGLDLQLQQERSLSRSQADEVAESMLKGASK